jgi:hypothetical protein
MNDRQQGMTTIGFLIIAVLVGLIGFAGLRLTPIFLENMKVASVMNDVKSDFDGQDPSIQQISAAIGKRLNIEMVRSVHRKDFEIKRSDNGYMVSLTYDREAPYVANVYLLVRFDRAVEIRR